MDLAQPASGGPSWGGEASRDLARAAIHRELQRLVDRDFEIPYMLSVLAVLIYFAGFISGWAARTPVVSHRGVQTEEPKHMMANISMRRRELPIHHGSSIFVTQTGECFHRYRECFGLRKAVQIKELKRCKVCSP